MPAYGSGSKIPQVAIQPSALPVAANILPAAGQPVRGNTLQQIAEALAPFNQGLLAFGKRAVDVDNERAAGAGENLDFSGVSSAVTENPYLERGMALNSKFKEIVERSGASDAANPYFQIAARQNFGRTLGMKYRTAIWGMKEQVTDPDNPMTYEEASAKAAESVLGSSLQDDYYGFSGFRDVAKKTDSEMMLAFAEERMKRVETKGALVAKEAVMEAIVSGDMELANQTWGDYQTKVTDPTKVRANFIGMAQDVLKSSTSIEDLGDRMDRLMGIKYGNQIVWDNADLHAELVQFEQDARSKVLGRLEQESRLSGLALDKARKDLYASGFIGEAQRHASNNGEEIAGGRLSDWASNRIDELAQKNGWSQETTDQMRSTSLDLAQQVVARTAALSNVKSQENLVKLMGQIAAGSLTSEEQIWNASAEMGVQPDDSIKAIDYYSKRVGPAGAALNETVGSLTTQNAGLIAENGNSNGTIPFDANGRPTPAGALEAQKRANNIGTQVLAAGDDFIRGAVPDSSGKFYNEYLQQSQQAAAYAVKRFVIDKNAELVKADFESDARAAASGKVSVDGRYQARPEDTASKTWDSQKSIGDLVQQISQGKASATAVQVPEQIRSQWDGVMTRLAKDYDLGFGMGTAPNIVETRKAAAEALFRAMESGGPVVTNDARISGSVLRMLQFPGALIASPFIGTDRAYAAMDNAYNAFATKKDKNAILQDYGTVMRMGCLTLDEVLADADSMGLKVFGITIPLDPKERTAAAFSVPLIQSEDELRDTAKVSAVMKKFGLTDKEMPQFIRAQQILLQIKRRGVNEYEESVIAGGVSDAQVQEARSGYYRALEAAQQKANSK
jgi:hypothetical protein